MLQNPQEARICSSVRRSCSARPRSFFVRPRRQKRVSRRRECACGRTKNYSGHPLAAGWRRLKRSHNDVQRGSVVRAQRRSSPEPVKTRLRDGVKSAPYSLSSGQWCFPLIDSTSVLTASVDKALKSGHLGEGRSLVPQCDDTEQKTAGDGVFCHAGRFAFGEVAPPVGPDMPHRMLRGGSRPVRG